MNKWPLFPTHLKTERVCLAHSSRLTVRHRREISVVGVEATGYYIPSQEAEMGGCCSARSQSGGLVFFRVRLPASINQSGSSLISTARGLPNLSNPSQWPGLGCWVMSSVDNQYCASPLSFHASLGFQGNNYLPLKVHFLKLERMHSFRKGSLVDGRHNKPSDAQPCVHVALSGH